MKHITHLASQVRLWSSVKINDKSLSALQSFFMSSWDRIDGMKTCFRHVLKPVTCENGNEASTPIGYFICE